MDDSAYRYTPIKHHEGSDQEIRLLTVLPGVLGDRIFCRLETTTLGNTPVFEALSYTWSDPRGKYEGENSRIWFAEQNGINIDDCKFPVGRNLLTALQYIRETARTRTVWIDAICINQKDDDEKSHQVRAMGKIYSSAACVLAWLGEKKSDSNLAFDAIEELCWAKRVNIWRYCARILQKHISAICKDDLYTVAKLEEDGLVNPPRPILSLKHPKLQGNAHFIDAICSSPIPLDMAAENKCAAATSTFGSERVLARQLVEKDDDQSFLGFLDVSVLNALKDLCTREYWTRIWIIQEVILAKKMVLICGDRTVDFDEFTILLYMSLSIRLDIPQNSALSETITSSFEADVVSMVHFMEPALSFLVLKLGHESRQDTLFDWLKHCSRQYCSDPRDRVYGLLSLVPLSSVIADYTYTVEEVYTQAARDIIKQKGNLDIIFNHSRWEGLYESQFSYELPTWVPRFDLAHLESQPQFEMHQCGTAWKPQIENGSDTSVSLVVEGYLHGMIDKILHVWGTFSVGWHEILSLRSSLIKNGQQEEEFWKTLAMDIYYSSGFQKRRMSVDAEAAATFMIDLRLLFTTGVASSRLSEHMGLNLREKAFCLTKDGKFVLTHGDVRKGDCVFLARGASMPLIVRPVKPAESTLRRVFRRRRPSEQASRSEDVYTLAGAAYIHEYMDGSAMKRFADSGRALDTIVLV